MSDEKLLPTQVVNEAKKVAVKWCQSSVRSVRSTGGGTFTPTATEDAAG